MALAPFLLPAPLEPGDRIRIVAPSGVVDRDRFARGLARLEGAGHVPVFDEGLFARHRYLAGPDERRLEELRRAIKDEDARAIWVARGGYGATRLLGALDLDRLRERPRWLVGFSDATALHALWHRAGVATMHGPNVTTLDDWEEAARRVLWDALGGGRAPTLSGRLLRGRGPLEGRLLGGNLTVLAALAGTGHLPSFDGALVLLEDVDEAPYRLDRALTQLVQAGVLRGARGFVIGQLTRCEGEDEREGGPLDAVLDALAPLDVPVLAEVPVGHEPTSRAVLLGTPCVGSDPNFHT